MIHTADHHHAGHQHNHQHCHVLPSIPASNSISGGAAAGGRGTRGGNENQSRIRYQVALQAAETGNYQFALDFLHDAEHSKRHNGTPHRQDHHHYAQPNVVGPAQAHSEHLPLNPHKHVWGANDPKSSKLSTTKMHQQDEWATYTTTNEELLCMPHSDHRLAFG